MDIMRQQAHCVTIPISPLKQNKTKQNDIVGKGKHEKTMKLNTAPQTTL